MKYEVPVDGDYLSGLTAGILYDAVKSLLEANVPQDEIKAARLKSLNEKGKLWDRPEIRGELEEFVTSYFLSDLELPLPGFEEIFSRNANGLKLEEGKLDDYISRLKQHYESEGASGDEAISRLFGQLDKRRNRLYGGIERMGYFKMGEELIRVNARDAFAHISQVYGLVQVYMLKRGIESQLNP